MEPRMNWAGKYELSLREYLTLKDIMKLRECGQPTATVIRNKAITYCSKNNIEITSMRVPTGAVLAVTKCGIDYYHEKMLREREITNNTSGIDHTDMKGNK